MFLGDQIVFLELPRTGTRHIRALLDGFPSCRGELVGMHQRIYNLPEAVQAELRSKLKFGGVRNPWDWYVSLWASGWIRQITTGLPRQEGMQPPPPSAREWMAAHAEPTPECFRAFLRMLLGTHRIEAGHHFHRSLLSRSVGFLTFKYVRLYPYELGGQSAIQRPDDLERYDRRHNLLDAFVRFEQLDADLLAVLEHVGISDAERALVSSADRTAFRSNRELDYRLYYDEPCYRLVLENDAYLIEKHGYRFDPPAAWSPPLVRARP